MRALTVDEIALVAGADGEEGMSDSQKEAARAYAAGYAACEPLPFPYEGACERLADQEFLRIQRSAWAADPYGSNPDLWNLERIRRLF